MSANFMAGLTVDITVFLEAFVKNPWMGGWGEERQELLIIA